MKILITGGCGFIGSHLAHYFCERNVPVVILDNLSSGKVENLAWKTPGMALDVIDADAGDESVLRKIVPSCRQVFHLAALPSVPESVAHPLESHRDNLDLTLKVLLAARDANVERFVFASSCAVYGDGPENPKTEGTPTRPMSPYALQKLASEGYARIFFELYGLPTVSLRFFNIYGPRQASDSGYSGVIAKFCARMLRGLPPEVCGDGRQTRDFTYVKDVAAAVATCAEAPVKEVAGKCFNIATGKSSSLIDLIDAINRLTGQSLQPSFAAPRSGDILVSEASIAAAQAAFGYAPKFSLEEGLGPTLGFYREGV